MSAKNWSLSFLICTMGYLETPAASFAGPIYTRYSAFPGLDVLLCHMQVTIPHEMTSTLKRLCKGVFLPLRPPSPGPIAMTIKKLPLISEEGKACK